MRVNPSYEYMRRIRREKQAALLDIRRERVTKALDGLTLHGDANAMLAQIAYSIHPHVGAWDAESCDHLRNVLTELIGDAREAASGVESHIPCGASGCHSGDEQKEVADGMAGGSSGMREDSGVGACGCMDYSDVHQETVGYPLTQYDVLGNERHKAVCALREWKPETNYSTDGMGEIHIRILYQILDLGGAMMMDGTDAAKAVRDRLIHLLSGDQSDDTSPMTQENETGITDELRKYVCNHETTTTLYAMLPMPPQLKKEPTPNGDKLLAIAGEIDERAEKLAHDVEMWRDRADDMRMERDNAERERDAFKDKLDELSTSGATELYNLLKMTVGNAKHIADKLNAHNGTLKESERLRRESAKCAADAINKACMYLNLLRDAAKDYKALQDRLNHMVEVCQIYTEANA